MGPHDSNKILLYTDYQGMPPLIIQASAASIFKLLKKDRKIRKAHDPGCVGPNKEARSPNTDNHPFAEVHLSRVDLGMEKWVQLLEELQVILVHKGLKITASLNC